MTDTHSKYIVKMFLTLMKSIQSKAMALLGGLYHFILLVVRTMIVQLMTHLCPILLTSTLLIIAIVLTMKKVVLLPVNLLYLLQLAYQQTNFRR